MVDVAQGDDGGEGPKQGLERVCGAKGDRVGDWPVSDMGCCREDPQISKHRGDRVVGMGAGEP